jgi:hypothetical protein
MSETVQGRTARARHHDAVLAAEVRRLARALRTVGPMPRPALARATGCDHWREGNFEAALEAGLRSGRLRELPLGFVAAAPRQPRTDAGSGAWPEADGDKHERDHDR